MSNLFYAVGDHVRMQSLPYLDKMIHVLFFWKQAAKFLKAESVYLYSVQWSDVLTLPRDPLVRMRKMVIV